ncbi:unnamed protein product, partial [Adineta ricciae]
QVQALELKIWIYA